MTEIIAEIASNHGGSAAWQEKLIESAARAGADWVKFQSYQTKHLSPSDPQYQWLSAAELSDEDHVRLMALCKRHGIQFLTTVFNADRVPFLASLKLEAIKIGSGEAMDEELLRAVAQHGWRVFLSTGLMTEHDCRRARHIICDNELTVMHTVSQYPTPPDKVNLGRVHRLPCYVTGYSDHTVGAAAALAAIGIGAKAVEVHLSSPVAPRCQVWDKTEAELAYIVEFRNAFERMTKPGPMWADPQTRPFVGRWRHVG